MACLADVELKQLDQLLKEMNRENTHRSSDVTWNVWKSYTAAKNIVVGPKTIWKNELNHVLKKSYVEVWKTDSNQYKKSSLTTGFVFEDQFEIITLPKKMSHSTKQLNWN